MIVTTDAISGMIMHREDRSRPGEAPTETTAAADVEIVDERDKNQGWPLRTMPQAVDQIPPPWSLWETLLQKRMPYYGDWENSIAC